MVFSDSNPTELSTQLKALLQIKKQYADLNVAIHEIATMLAQGYLKKKYPEIASWQLCPRAEVGLDISGHDSRGLQVVAEVTAHQPIKKTATGKPRFGAEQKQRMRGIVDKLLREKQAVKYLFVITNETRNAVVDEFETSEIQIIDILNLLG
jgi:hypothetical protein